MTTKWWNILISFVKKIKLPYFCQQKWGESFCTLGFRPTLYSISVLRIRPYKGSNFLTKWFYTSACMLSHFSCVRLFVTLWTIAYQAPLSMGLLQGRILEWVAMPSSTGSSWPRDWTHVSCSSCIAGGFLTTEPPGKPILQLGTHDLVFFCPCLKACGNLSSQTGTEPESWQWKLRILTSRPPGTSPWFYF